MRDEGRSLPLDAVPDERPTQQSNPVPSDELSVCEDIIQHLREGLLNGSYKPGDRLPGERTLAEELGVSRSSIREAMRLLSLIGVLSKRVGSGTRFAESGEGVLDIPFEFVMLLDGVSLEHLFEARELVEVHLAELAAERRTQKDLDEIAASLGLLVASESGPEQSAVTNRDFHKAVAKAAHSPALERFVRVVLDARSARIKQLCPEQEDWKGWTVTHETHERIYQAIKERNATAARRAMHMDMAMADEFWRYIQKRARETGRLPDPAAEADVESSLGI